MLFKCLSYPVAYPRTTLTYGNGRNDLWIGRITNQMFRQTDCLIVIFKASMENQREVFGLAKQMEKLSTETKLLAVVAADSFVDEQQFVNISFNTLIFQIKAGSSRYSVTNDISLSLTFYNIL